MVGFFNRMSNIYPERSDNIKGRCASMANKEQGTKKSDKKKPSDTKVKKEKKTYN